MLPSLNSRYEFASKSCICNMAVSFLLAARSRFSVFSADDYRLAAPQKWGTHISLFLPEVNRGGPPLFRNRARARDRNRRVARKIDHEQEHEHDYDAGQPALSVSKISAYCLVRKPSPIASLGRLFMKKTLISAALWIFIGATLLAASPAEQQVAEAIKAPNLSVVHLWAP